MKTTMEKLTEMNTFNTSEVNTMSIMRVKFKLFKTISMIMMKITTDTSMKKNSLSFQKFDSWIYSLNIAHTRLNLNKKLNIENFLEATMTNKTAP